MSVTRSNQRGYSLVLRLDPLGKVLDAQFLADELLALSHPEFEFNLQLSILFPVQKDQLVPSSTRAMNTWTWLTCKT